MRWGCVTVINRRAIRIFWGLILPIWSGFCTGCFSEQTITVEQTGADSETTDLGSDSHWDTDIWTDTAAILVPGVLKFNEVMSKNDGVVLDDALETDDWIELICTGDDPINLADYFIVEPGGYPLALPEQQLHPGEVVLFYADKETHQGLFHLDLKVSSAGEPLFLLNSAKEAIDYLNVPELKPNESFARYPDGSGDYLECRYATPGAVNGDECSPPVPKGMETIPFEAYEWSTESLAPAGPIVINEMALRPAGFIELLNISKDAVALGEVTIELSPILPGAGWPEAGEGAVLSLGRTILQPGERLSVEVNRTQLETLETNPRFEGVATLFDGSEVVDRVDFMSWPDGSALARMPDGNGRWIYCENTTEDALNECVPTPSREVGNRLRYLRTPSDFGKLAEGAAKLGIGSVKFVVDREGGDAVHLLSSWDWDLHYTFVREVIDGDQPLDRCDELENATFNTGWRQFSMDNYYDVEGRRYLLGTLSHHSSADLHCVEYTFGDNISPQQMVDGFYNAVAHTYRPSGWVLRPQDKPQIDKARTLEGQLPIVGPSAPFANVVYQTLSEGVGYGTLEFISAVDLPTASLGAQTIVVTNDVPNDIPYVGGLITEAFQTPLSHVNILSKSRNTPNIAVLSARSDDRIAPFLNQLVKLEVFSTHFEISAANPTEAQAHWDSLLPSGPMAIPLKDETVRGIVPLGPEIGFEHRGAIGAKAAQLSEMTRITAGYSRCNTTFPLPTPKDAFAVPVVHYMEHFEISGARALYDYLRANREFETDPTVRAEGLARLRKLILTHPVDPNLLGEVTDGVQLRFGNARVRFRSSSNTEDLQEFNGAGLYTSQSAQLGDEDRAIDDAIRVVWASLWNERAYDERHYARIDHGSVAMGILVHEAFLSEEVNGVAVSRDIIDVIRGDRYYVNAQAGEASVANPAPGVTTEQVLYQWPWRTPTLRTMANSSLVEGPVLWNAAVVPSDIYNYGEIEGEIRELVCALRAVHDHFELLLDPNDEEPLFAMEIEFKLEHATRSLMIKQTRPYSFGNLPLPADCRER